MNLIKFILKLIQLHLIILHSIILFTVHLINNFNISIIIFLSFLFFSFTNGYFVLIVTFNENLSIVFIMVDLLIQ